MAVVTTAVDTAPLVNQKTNGSVIVSSVQLQNGPETLKAPLPNPSLQVTADHKLKSVEAPVLAPQRGQVLLHIKATGVCG